MPGLAIRRPRATGPGRSRAPGPSLSRSAGEGLATAIAVPEPLASVSPPEATAQFEPMPQSFAEVVELFDRRREALLRSHLWSHVHLVGFEPGRIEFRPQE